MPVSFNLEALPRRVVLSRKGSDAAWGGRSSLRVGDELISLPIPESASRAQAAGQSGVGVRYGDLPRHARVGALQEHLRAIDAGRFVHLDPDLRPELRPELRPDLPPRLLARKVRAGQQVRVGQGRVGQSQERLFGQEGAAERHLRNQEVGPGDLFLFFGWFREATLQNGVWTRRGAEEHCLWGWLQIAESHAVSSAAAATGLDWAAHHPHVAHWDRYDRHNRLYRARRRLSFAPAVPGAGVFRWHPELTLTQRCTAGATRSQWCLPGFIRRTGLTYNQVDGPRCPAARGRVHLSSAPIGQEFVLPAHRAFRQSERPALAAWLAELFKGFA